MSDRWFTLDEIRQIMANGERQMREKQEQLVREYQALMESEEDSDG
jgi:hypothetical protein